MRYQLHTGGGWLLTLLWSQRKEARLSDKVSGCDTHVTASTRGRRHAGNTRSALSPTLCAQDALSSGVCIIIFCLQFDNLHGYKWKSVNFQRAWMGIWKMVGWRQRGIMGDMIKPLKTWESRTSESCEADGLSQLGECLELRKTSLARRCYADTGVHSCTVTGAVPYPECMRQHRMWNHRANKKGKKQAKKGGSAVRHKGFVAATQIRRQMEQNCAALSLF